MFWEWESGIEPGERPAPFVGIWARGGAKSTSAELGTVDLGARGKRKYCLYVSGTQDQANDHVSNIATMLESDALARYVPEMGERRVGKYGNAKGWRRNRLWTAHGFVVDAIGLDTAARGVKLEEQRPDLIVLDDIDDSDDTPETTRKKIGAITKRLIPAGSADVAVLAIQNLIIPDGVFAQLADGRADWLSDRIVSGPIPALYSFTYTPDGDGYRITGGEPSWEGQDLARCQEMLNGMGLVAFLTECQHEVDAGGDLLVFGRRPDGMRYYEPSRNRVKAPWALEDSKWVIGGVDPGGRDPSSMSVTGVSGDDRIHRFREELVLGTITAREAAEWFFEQSQHYDAILYDPSQESFGAGLREFGLPAVAANNARRYGIGVVREYLLSGRYTIDERCEATHRQMFEYWEVPRPLGQASSGDRDSYPTRTGAGHHADSLDEGRYVVVFIHEHFPRRGPGKPRPQVATRPVARVR